MSRSRGDLTNWLIHFVHRANPSNDIFEDDEAIHLPMHTDPDTIEKFEPWATKDGYERDRREPDAYPISVLEQILDDGHLRASWSVRKGKPTIYGPRPAVCFTEMPLGALVEYARARGNESSVAAFGIAVPRDEAFGAGTRPVIYGLSTQHREIASEYVLPRYLHPDCGIGKDEQYRYVALNLGAGSARSHRRIDWMHEREWRWCDVKDASDVPGLPLWLKDGPQFSTVLIVVKERGEAERVLDQLQTMHDQRADEYEVAQYSRSAIGRTRVLALDEIRVPITSALRIEDLDVRSLSRAQATRPDARLRTRVAKALIHAEGAAKNEIAGKSYGGTFGMANVVNGSPRSAVAQALLQLKEATAQERGYVLWDVAKCARSGLRDEAEDAARAAKEVLANLFPECSWWVWSRPD